MTDLRARAAVENVLYDVLARVGAIHPFTVGGPSGIKWSRSSRTDRGVHALRNVFSFKVRHCVSGPSTQSTDAPTVGADVARRG